MDNAFNFILQAGILLFSVIIHEVAHGVMALRLGDETAKNEGRLTLNPLVHLDPIGSVLLPLLLFLTQSPIILGWAKPVPYNPMFLFKDYKYGPLKVALAGPASNLVLAIVFSLIIRFGGEFFVSATLDVLVYIVLINSVLFVFNMLPIPPLDGSKILTTFLPFEYARQLESLGFGGIMFVFLIIALFPGLIFGLAYSLAILLTGGVPT